MRKLFDSLLRSSIWVQLLALVVTLIISGILFYIIGDICGKVLSINTFGVNDDSRFSENWLKVWYVISRLLDPGYVGESSDKLFAFMITVVGWVLCTGFLIAIITNAYFDRIKNLELGLFQYDFKNHLVIFGYETMTVGFIKDFGFQHPNKDIVVMTEQQVSDVLRQLKSQIASKRCEKRIYVLQGGRDIEEEIARVKPQHAHKIIILGEKDEPGKDARNIDCFKNITKVIHHETPKKAVPIYVHFEKLKTFQLAKDYNVSNEYKNYVEFFPFNFHEQWAQRVFINYAPVLEKATDPDYSPLDYMPITAESEQYVHLILLGYNRMSVALAIEAARHCHFPNDSKTKITFFDMMANTHRLSFFNQYQGIGCLDDIEFDFKQVNVFDPYFRNTIKAIVASNAMAADKNSLPYIAVCFEEPDLALEVGLNLPKVIYQKRIPVIIRQKDRHQILDSVYPSIRFFGELEYSTIPHEIRDILAEKAHLAYEKLVNNDTITAWKELNATFKWANRTLVDNYPVVLRSFSLSMKEVVDEPHTLIGKVNLDAHSRVEHRRWMAERVFSGWSYGEKRNDFLKIHPDLQPYDKLSKSEKKKDTTLVLQMFGSFNSLKEGQAFKNNWEDVLPSRSCPIHLYRKTALVKARQLVENETVVTLENSSYKGKKGEFLCKGVVEEIWIHRQSSFEEKYERISDKPDEYGFDLYKPIPERNIVVGTMLTTIKTITLKNGQLLTGKIGDMHLSNSREWKNWAECVDGKLVKKESAFFKDESDAEEWIVDYEVFMNSYIKI